MKSARLALAALSLLLLTGCLPAISKTPAGGATQGIDAALAGDWRELSDGDKDKPACLHIETSAARLAAVMHPCGTTGATDDDMRLEVTTAILGKNRILNATITGFGKEMLTGQEKMPGPMVLIYRLENGKLSVLAFDDAALEKLVAAGTLDGEKSSGGDWQLANAAKLDAFLARPDAAAAFKPLAEFVRIQA